MLVFCSNSRSLWRRMNAWVVSTIPCSSHPRMVVIAEANHVRGWSGIFVSRSLGDWWGYNQEPTISWGIIYSILGILLWFIGIFEQQHGDIHGNCRLVLVIQQFAMVWTVRLLDDEVAIFHSKLSNNQRAYVVWEYLGHAKRNPSRFDSYIHWTWERNVATDVTLTLGVLYDLCRIRMDSCEYIHQYPMFRITPRME